MSILFAVLLSANVWGAESAYSLLRSQFHKSEVPNIQDLQLEKNWHCSGSLAAAKGLFRSVGLWDLAYHFTNQEGELVNLAHRAPGKFKMGDRSFYSANLSDHLRVNQMGDLIVEVTLPQWSPWSTTSRVQKLPAISLQGETAHSYLICENPDSHDNPDWYRRRIWSTDIEEAP